MSASILPHAVAMALDTSGTSGGHAYEMHTPVLPQTC